MNVEKARNAVADPPNPILPDPGETILGFAAFFVTLTALAFLLGLVIWAARHAATISSTQFWHEKRARVILAVSVAALLFAVLWLIVAAPSSTS